MNIGVWIDTQKAILVTETNGETSIATIESGIDTRPREDGEGNPAGRFGDQHVEPENKRGTKLHEQTGQFLKSVEAALSSSSQIVVFGPAQMKLELKKHIESNAGLATKLKGVETTDSMTDNQVAAWVKDYFAKQ